METAVTNNEAGGRYELAIDGGRAIAAHELGGGVITFTHTVVPAAARGRGAGSRLVAAALADARARGLRVVPRCPFVARYMAGHPETRDLLAGRG